MKATLILIALTLMSFGKTTNKGEALCKINNDDIRAFVSKHWEHSEYIYLTTGVPMAISLSQWILESGYASDPLAKKRKNLGGIMSYEGGKKHLKKFSSYNEFYRSYAKIFTKDCYKDFQPRGIDMWLESLTFPCCSYARSDKYRSKLSRIIKLYQFDQLPI